MGVFAPWSASLAACRAAEALKLITGVGSSLAGRLLMLDGRDMQWNEMRTQRDPDAPSARHQRTGRNAPTATARNCRQARSRVLLQ